MKHTVGATEGVYKRQTIGKVALYQVHPLVGQRPLQILCSAPFKVIKHEPHTSAPNVSSKGIKQYPIRSALQSAPHRMLEYCGKV